ncbi:uncharacterized protein LOC122052482 isoform X2 [Zingiber officinale]|uniref:uncharacterized protein LOC122052482 isoform X2 n=1 Tax=Zingiber officinale TaxID=94328 RepID=UPI001C4B3305|nr:uncharacterized protein LOC122052482 isoform X2 [Zingiber officinale]
MGCSLQCLRLNNTKMQPWRCGRFADYWGSCERHEKKFTKPDNGIPSTAETRAKNKACQVISNLSLGSDSSGNRCLWRWSDRSIFFVTSVFLMLSYSIFGFLILPYNSTFWFG